MTCCSLYRSGYDISPRHATLCIAVGLTSLRHATLCIAVGTTCLHVMLRYVSQWVRHISPSYYAMRRSEYDLSPSHATLCVAVGMTSVRLMHVYSFTAAGASVAMPMCSLCMLHFVFVCSLQSYRGSAYWQPFWVLVSASELHADPSDVTP
jgi:hypothetical protein